MDIADEIQTSDTPPVISQSSSMPNSSTCSFSLLEGTLCCVMLLSQQTPYSSTLLRFARRFLPQGIVVSSHAAGDEGTQLLSMCFPQPLVSVPIKNVRGKERLMWRLNTLTYLSLTGGSALGEVMDRPEYLAPELPVAKACRERDIGDILTRTNLLFVVVYI